MTPVSLVPGFLPSTHGLHFANRFAPGPTVRLGPFDTRWIGGLGDASAGLCGGMAWYVRERFAAGLPIVITGDFNADSAEMGDLAALADLSLAPECATFPSTEPRFALDRVLVSDHWRVTGRKQIWIMSAAGADLTHLSNSSYNDWDAVWIP